MQLPRNSGTGFYQLDITTGYFTNEGCEKRVMGAAQDESICSLSQ